MPLAIPLAWLQLTREKLRLTIALSGVGFAVVLIFMQLGFREALYESSVLYHRALRYDLAMVSPRTEMIVGTESFSRRRLHQVRGFAGVRDVSAVYIGTGIWKHPIDTRRSRGIFVLAFDPVNAVLALPEVEARLDELRRPDVVLFDRASRPEFGPVPAMLEAKGRIASEVGTRRVEVVGLFTLGTSFAIDASLITSDLNFLRLFPDREPGLIDFGLIQLDPGADAGTVRDAIVSQVPNDVEVLTREEFIAREIAYWNATTPIGYVFSFGVMMGLAVGAIIVYQILFSDVSDHLGEYATLKAMGYSNGYLFGVVIQEAVILAILGFLPGLGLSAVLYHLAGNATQLPLLMTAERVAFVASLSVGMCIASGSIALRKVRSADPADVF